MQPSPNWTVEFQGKNAKELCKGYKPATATGNIICTYNKDGTVVLVRGSAPEARQVCVELFKVEVPQ